MKNRFKLSVTVRNFLNCNIFFDLEGRTAMSETLVWAHRGASGYAPENTLEAFEKAVEMKADGVELDIQLSKDGEIVVIHDEWIDRVTEGKGEVRQYTLAELKRFHANRTFPEFQEARIPTLAEVYELLKPTNLTINVELKTGVFFYPGIEEKVLKLTKEMGMEDRIWYSSFNHYTVKRLKEKNPEAKTGILYADGIYGIGEYAEMLNADALHPALYNVLYPDMVEECHSRGKKIHVWTVNEVSYIQKMLELGVDAIIGNYPDRIRKCMK